jgi:hypothetical protein
VSIFVDYLFDTAPFTRASTPRCFASKPGKPKFSCHMWSDLSGEAGTRELVAFARKLGLRPDWIQKAGTVHEHFDLVPAKRLKAIAAGAKETVWVPKKAAEARP